MSIDNFNDDKRQGAIWALDAYITGAGTPVASGLRITVPTGSEIEIISIRATMEDVGAALAVSITHKDSLFSGICLMMHDDMDNVSIYGPYQKVILSTITDNTVDTIGCPVMPYPIGGTDLIDCQCGNLDTGKDFTIRLRARIRGAIPTVEATGAGIVLTTTYSKVI